MFHFRGTRQHDQGYCKWFLEAKIIIIIINEVFEVYNGIFKATVTITVQWCYFVPSDRKVKRFLTSRLRTNHNVFEVLN